MTDTHLQRTYLSRVNYAPLETYIPQQTDL